MTEPSPADQTPVIRPLSQHRAVMGQGVDCAVPVHYGAPLREQRALLRGKAVVDLAHFTLLEVGGPDAPTWLSTISSQVFTNRETGSSFEAAVLSPQGRVEHWVQVIALEHSYLLILEPGAHKGLRSYLELMTFAHRIELIDRADLRVLGSVAHPRTVLPHFSPVAVWTQDWPQVAPGGLAYGPDPEFTEPWHLGVFRGDDLEAGVRAGELTANMFAGLASAEALRIANHRPRFTNEIDERTIPHEVDLLRTAVHTAKGCYRGQETVAKVMNLGQPPRRLVMLHLDGSQDIPTPAGAEVKLGNRTVGTVTSSALHADDGPIALALIRRAVPLDQPLTVTFSAGEESEHTLSVDASQVPIVLERDHGKRPETANLGSRSPRIKPGI